MATQPPSLSLSYSVSVPSGVRVRVGVGGRVMTRGGASQGVFIGFCDCPLAGCKGKGFSWTRLRCTLLGWVRVRVGVRVRVRTTF